MTALQFAEDHQEQFLEELKHILRLPSISTLDEHKEDIERMAEWLRVHLMETGMHSAEVHQTKGHPVVYGEWIDQPGKPTLLIYGHYDVQPVDPIDEWKTDPFDPEIDGDYIYARGVADDKGQFFTHLKAIQAFLTTQKSLPVNIKVLLEGEEELGSENLEAWIAKNKELLKADYALISDSHMDAPDEPRLELGLRGLVYFEVTVKTAEHDLHSGTYGGGVGNAATVLCEMLAKLKDKNQKILIPEFYKDVQKPTTTELKKLHFDEKSFKKTSGSYYFVHEPKIPSHKMPGLRPSLDINGMTSGFTGHGQKTVIPNTATAKVSTRLVAHQDPDKVAENFMKFISKLAPKGVEVKVEVLSKSAPVLIPDDNQAIVAAQKAQEETFGNKTRFAREGGSIPVVEIFQRLLGVESVLMGYGLPDDNLHAPNERFYLPHFYKGIDCNIRFYELMGASE